MENEKQVTFSPQKARALSEKLQAATETKIANNEMPFRPMSLVKYLSFDSADRFNTQLAELHYKALALLKQENVQDNAWKTLLDKFQFDTKSFGVHFALTSDKDYEPFENGGDGDWNLYLSQVAALTYKAIHSQSKEEMFLFGCEITKRINTSLFSFDFEHRQITDGFLNQAKRPPIEPQDHIKLIYRLCDLMTKHGVEVVWQNVLHQFRLAERGKENLADQAIIGRGGDDDLCCKIAKLEKSSILLAFDGEPIKPITFKRIENIISDWRKLNKNTISKK